ncbi:MAG: flagellar hook-basal body complex protein [Alphaproteobacteria bacterium]|nr:flagellar hook-basal body complex protein [Alphaproteobacteria bacterium]
MGLFGSLFTGVSGLFSQSQNTAIIANNIANVSTTGFKRSEASFQSLVTTESRLSTYSPGTVSVNRIQRVTQQGSIQQTSSGTDSAISGNGMFPIKRSTDSGQEFLYTRAGQFSEDSQGLMRNAAGFILYAWPINANGDLPANQGDLVSLVPTDVAFLGGLTRPTSNAELAINLDADTIDETFTSLPTAPADFSRGLTVYDSLGSSQTITLQYTKTYGPAATSSSVITSNAATTDLTTDLGLLDGDQFTISVDGGAVRTFEINDVAGNPTSGGEDIAVVTIGDIISDINNNVAGASAFLGNNGELVVQRDDFTGGAAQTITLAEVGLGTAISGLGLTAGVYTSDDLAGGGSPYNNGAPGDSPPYSQGDFPTPQNLPGDLLYNKRGWWKLEIIHPDGSSVTNGLLNFNGDGTINALQDTDGNIDVALSSIDWGNGSEPQNLDVDIERFSQFSGNFDVIFSDQNGAELGLRTGIEITRDGIVVARFSNGASADLYKVPLITFANANGLTEVSGTAYTESEESGEENLRAAGTGGAGFVEPSTLEASNVDLADEFAKLIVAQRAFGASTRVISTVDQMTEELLRLR